MTDLSDNYWMAASDPALMQNIGSFIRHQRLQQNKTQQQLANEAGIARSTLSLFEQGENTGMIVFIQVLRALKLLYLLEGFRVQQQVSPIQLARLEKSKRIRAGRMGREDPTHESDW